jgi:hypothetical protein
VRTSFPDSLSCLPRQSTAAARADSVGRQDSTRVPSTRGSAASEAPTIVLRASVSAREVRFASQPRIEVRLCGGVLDSVRVLERTNLPDPVQPGVTYRNVYVAVEILGHLNAECLASRVAGQGVAQRDVCASIQVRDTAGATRRPPP